MKEEIVNYRFCGIQVFKAFKFVLSVADWRTMKFHAILASVMMLLAFVHSEVWPVEMGAKMQVEVARYGTFVTPAGMWMLLGLGFWAVAFAGMLIYIPWDYLAKRKVTELAYRFTTTDAQVWRVVDECFPDIKKPGQ